MQPSIEISGSAIGLAVLASFFFGFLWYGPLFGKKWAALMKMDMSHTPSPGVMAKMYGIQLFGTFLTAFVLLHSVQAWQPSSWIPGQEDGPPYIYGFFAGFFTWLGFYIPMLFGTVTWESKPWSLFVLNAAYHFFNLQMIGMVLAYMSA